MVGAAVLVHYACVTILIVLLSATGDGADDDCPSNTIKKFNKSSNQSVLIVWDSTDLEDLIENVDTDASLDNDSLGLQ
jgi:hypothetical protein